ncbi:MAG: DUF1398 family protein [Gemmatimonadales bacterium]
MTESAQTTIERCARESYAGTISFGAVVSSLAEIGVEAYRADYRTQLTTYYLADGSPVSLALRVPDLAVPDGFDPDAVQEAIRGSQRGEIKYPEFISRSMAAGCVGYTVWIAGRHVAYYGRRGEVHVEPFPPARAG